MDIKQIEQKISELINKCKGLQQENDSLKREVEEAKTECARLHEKKSSTIEKVEMMLQRLKSIEG